MCGRKSTVQVSNTDQVLYARLQLHFGLFYRLLLAEDGDRLLISIAGRGEDDSRPSAISHLTDVAATTANQELVVLWLGVDLDSVAGLLLQCDKDKLLITNTNPQPWAPKTTWLNRKASFVDYT